MTASSEIGSDPISPGSSVPSLVSADERLISLWLHDKAPHTQRAYRRDIASFLAYVQVPLAQVRLDDVQGYATDLDGRHLAPATRARRVAAIKSLLAFGARIRVLPTDVGAVVSLPKRKDSLAERILTEADVAALIGAAAAGRDRALLRLLYKAGLRRSEACALRWRDLKPNRDGGQITIFGKGGKTRVVVVRKALYAELLALKETPDRDGAIFRGRDNHPLSPSQAWRIIKAAATAAGVDPSCSPHWLRHSHATHALEKGVAIHLVQNTLGHASVATTGRYLHARPSDSSGLYLDAGD